MKIRETIRCCSFFLRTHVKISSKISIIEFNIQIKWCIIVTPSREAEKDYQGYFNSPPHKKNHIATTMINTVLFKISTHILTKRMTSTGDMLWEANLYFNSHPREEDDASNFPRLIALSISTHILTKRMTGQKLISISWCTFQLTSSRRGWHQERSAYRPGRIISTHILTKRMTCSCSLDLFWILFQLTSSRRGWPVIFMAGDERVIFQLTSSRRGWRRVQQAFQRLWYFNSHPHEEDDVRSYQFWL